jgi:hypothetical protein
VYSRDHDEAIEENIPNPHRMSMHLQLLSNCNEHVSSGEEQVEQDEEELEGYILPS